MDKLIGILENYVEADEFCESTHFKNDLSLSSFDVVCIANDIEMTFGVKISPKDFIKHKTVGDMASYIESLK